MVSTAGRSLDSVNPQPSHKAKTNTEHPASPTLDSLNLTTKGGNSPSVTSGASKMAASSDITDDSFVIDLPPMSQLDSSVLEALPPYLREKILNEYANKKDDSTQKQVQLIPAIPSARSDRDHILNAFQDKDKALRDGGTNTQDIQIPHSGSQISSKELLSNDPVIIDNEDVFLKEVRSYVRDWILNFLEGPISEDVYIVSEYLLKLTDSNLNVASLALKSMRRFINELELIDWFSVFNQLLSNIQLRVTSVYGGQLLINLL